MIHFLINSADFDKIVISKLTALSLSAAAIVAAASVIVGVISIDPFVIGFMLFPLIGNFIFARRSNALSYRRDREMEPFQRRIRYVNRVLYLPEYAKEIRLSRVSRVLDAIRYRPPSAG